MEFGIDVSKWQGNFNFAQAKAEGVKFAILKAGGGDAGLYKDKKFESYYKSAKENGIAVGAYFFGCAYTINQAIKEADKFISLLKGKQFEYPVYYDVEGKMLDVSNELLTEIIITFCSRVEAAGYFTGFYTGEYAVNNHMDDNRLKRFTHWIAKWSKTAPKIKSGMRVGIWQYGGETNKIRDNKVAGVVCDQDYSYEDFPSKIKELGLNGFNEPIPESEHKVKVFNCNYLNCRDSAGGTVIGVFKAGTVLTLIDKDSKWCKVSGMSTDGNIITGYCSTRYLWDV